MDTILEIIQYTLPSLIVLAATLYTIRSFLSTDDKRKQYELRMQNQRSTIPIRLQAYERLALFCERIAPNNLIHRVRKPHMTAQELNFALIQDIRHEYDHNLSQQIYVSPDTWNLVTVAKEEMITVINRLSGMIPPDVPEKELSKKIFEFFMSEGVVLPTQKALSKLKSEVKYIY